MDKAARLFHQRFGNLRVGMAQAADSDARAQIKITLAGNIPEITPGPVTEREVETRVARHHVFLEQRLNGCHIVAHDRRWRNDFFHLMFDRGAERTQDFFFGGHSLSTNRVHYNLRADARVCENLEQHGVVYPAIDK